MKNSTAGKYEVLAEINMIPLIDVALVLLIIFMVMTPILVKSQIKINLPKSQTSENTATDDKKTVDITVEKNGTIYVEGDVVAADDLFKRLQELVFDPENQPVVVEADRDVPFEKVVVVMDAAKRLGIVRLGIGVSAKAVEKKKPEKRALTAL